MTPGKTTRDNQTQDNQAHDHQVQDKQPPLMGLATLMSMAYAGVDLRPLGIQLAERAGNNPEDANALMDLSTVMQLTFSPDVALDLQAQALAISRHYKLPAANKEAVRLLALMAPGELMANAPLEFLVQDSDINLEMFYLSEELPLPVTLPEHDVLFVAVNESDANRLILKQIETVIQSTTTPVLNAPERIARLSRNESYTLLKSVPGMIMPAAHRLERQLLADIGQKNVAIDTVLEQGEFPVIVRPVGSHAGHGLRKIEAASAISAYLNAHDDNEFVLSPFIDYCGSDGLYRKYRLVLIDGRPFACHMAISSQWMVHYLNAYMSDSEAKRAEEAQFMETFEQDFARRHAQALHGIAERTGLDYLIIDCAETSSGELLVFEIDSGAVVHAMDSPEVFPYKPPQMRKIFAAFRELLIKTKGDNSYSQERTDGDCA